MSTEPMAVRMVTAGYVVASRTQRSTGYDAGVPAPFLTMSVCLADVLRVPEFSGWFQNLEEARHALSAAPNEALVLVVSMATRDAAELIRAVPDEPEHFRLLEAGTPEPEGVRWLGFEIVGAEGYLSFHSWHCHNYAMDAEAELGIRVNSDGLLETYEDASEVREWMLGLPPDERPLSVPWAIIRLGSVAN